MFNMFFAWNVRGLNSDRRHTMTKDWINIHRPLFGAFLETHIMENNKERILGAIPRGWNFFGNFEEDVSGRIIIVWDPTVTMCIYHATAQSVTCGATILSENITLTVTFVYGFNQVEERRALWDSLVELQDTSPVASHPWSVIGDFNQMLRTNHHSNHLFSRVDEAGMDDANLGLQDAQLFEAQTKGPPYTWRNMQDDNPISTKIDHSFINQAWSSAFPDSYAEFLDPSQSDHAPCLLRMPSIRRRVVKPFKLFHHVIDHPEYAETVADNWKCDDIVGTDQFKLVRLLKKLKRPLRSLNKRHFSVISQRVKGQKEKVDALQRALLTSPDNATTAEEHVERDKLNTLLKAEEKFYRQRSRVRWADVGDRNTPFYHRTVSQHASRNHIHYLKDTDYRMLFSMDDIKAHAANYFQGILGSTVLPFSAASSEDLTSLLPFRCTELQQNYLKREVTAAEIKATLFSMPMNKSPGPDGYSVEFIRASWDTVGEDVIKAVREFFRNGKLLKDMNTTAISLIPKKPEACSLSDFRPISCCNIVYKLISKIIANRLKPILSECVSPNQAAFLKGRSLGENVLLATELIKDYNKSSCHQSAMLKIDIRKAFDTVCWEFVTKVLAAQEFPPMFIAWIQECISSPRFSIAINGELAGFFEGKEGLRQGDSISPYLFIMLMEVLSRLLDRAQAEGSFRLHPLCSDPKLTHLLFADDLLVFSDGSRMSTAAIKETMNLFKNWSGLDINETKSEIFYGGYSDIQKSVLSDFSGFQRGEFPTRYLGLPLSPKRISAATLQPLVDRITSKLHSWTVKFLSFAGKVTMIYSVIYGMVNFWSSVFVLPKWFYAKVDSLCSGFLWKNNTTSAIGARVSWVNICKPKSEGGLGIRQLEEFETVFRLKRVWLFFSESGSLWVSWLRNNRFGGRSFWQINDAQRFCSTVRSMIQLKPDLQGFLRCSIGDGKTAMFWYDYWTELGLLLLLFGSSGPRTLRIPLNATVSQAVSNGHWNLPPARSDIAETLHVILSTTRVPTDANGKDAYLWRNQSGGFAASFSSRVTWERLRTPNPSVQWHSFVWFKEEIPRCSFISWTAFLGRLPTRDRLISWGLSVPPGCVFCTSANESHNHLFFQCAFAAAIWLRYCGRYMASPPASLDAVTVQCRNLQGPQARRVAVVLKLLCQVIVYNLWRERNARIFRDVRMNQDGFFRVVDRSMRDRLLSPSLISSSSPSMLELYIWFLSPYS